MSRRTPIRFRDAAFVSQARLDDGRANNEWFKTQHERNYALAEQRRQEDMSKEKSPMGLTRAQLKTEDAHGAIGSLNQRLDEGLDQVRVAFQREAQARQGEAAQQTDDAGRATALRNRGA